MDLARVFLLSAFITGSLYSHAVAAGAETANPYGLGRIMSPAGVRAIQVAPMVVGHKTVYAADLYGDGLVRFAIGSPPPDGDSLSINQISEAIGQVATGGVSQATTYHNQDAAIIIEPAASAGEAGETTAPANAQSALYHRPWEQPVRITLKKPKITAAKIAALTAARAANPVLRPMPQPH